MTQDRYYREYLHRTNKFPQSVYHRHKHNLVDELIKASTPEALILDAACGVGHLSGIYAEQKKIVGIDEQFSAISDCISSYKGVYSQASLYEIPFPDNQFDLILFLDAIEHFTDPEKALGELARILKPEGKILICTMNYDSPLWYILGHTWHCFMGGNCQPYSKDVHPTPYTRKLFEDHCQKYFKQISLFTRVMGMELFFIGTKKSG